MVKVVPFGSKSAMAKYNVTNDGWEVPMVQHKASDIWKSVLSTHMVNSSLGLGIELTMAEMFNFALTLGVAHVLLLIVFSFIL